MFNLINVKLSMCVKEYSDLFLNLIIEYEPILTFIPFKKIISHDGKKFVIVPAWREKLEKIPAWRDKDGIVLVLTNPVWRKKFDIVLILHGRRKLWWLMCLTVLFYCDIVIKHSMSLRRTESYRRTSR
jgi:hypothetical protein